MGKKKTKTSTTTTDHVVTTPTNPDWMTSTAQSLNSRLQGLGAMDPSSFVAPVSGLQQQAADAASGLSTASGGSGSGVGGDAWFSKLMNQPAPTVSSASLLDNLSAYENPYRDQVVDASMADFDADANRTRAAQDLALAGQGAFGGSGAALTRSQSEGELARARNTQLSNLLSGMFTTSAGLSNQDAARRQEASTANAQLAAQTAQNNAQMAQFQANYGLSRDANARANIATQDTLGQQLRDVGQQQRNAPLTSLGQQIEMFSGLPLAMFHGSTTDSKGTNNSSTTTGSDLAAQIANAAMQAAAASSGAPVG
jgi:hypothetical protein